MPMPQPSLNTPKTGKPFKPEEIKFVKNAYEMGLGEINLSKVRIKKVSAA